LRLPAEADESTVSSERGCWKVRRGWEGEASVIWYRYASGNGWKAHFGGIMYKVLSHAGVWQCVPLKRLESSRYNWIEVPKGRKTDRRSSEVKE
jgi:hypothetical protein